MSKLEGKTIVLIAGQPKAGTTSLFDWLSQHPQVGAGKLKELRFFLDPNYPLQSPLRFDGTNLDSYLSLFKTPERRVLLDASPDYISCDTPLCLPSLHADAKAIIVVRDPVERMISAYRFFRGRGLIPDNMSFDDYINKQNSETITAKTEVQYRALDHCRTGYYLPRWRAAFGDNILVLDFEDLKKHPATIIDSVCNFLDIERVHDIESGHKNKTRSYRFTKLYKQYCRVRRWFASNTVNYPFLYNLIRPLGRLISRGFVSSEEDNASIHVAHETRLIILARQTER